MVSMPYIKRANPTRMVPMLFFLSFLENKRSTAPIRASTGEKELGFKSSIKRLVPSIPVRLKIQEVAVVPILAPMMIPTAWLSFMMPEFTNPTTITVVAEDDWITAVTPAPKSTACQRFFVKVSRMRSILPPDAWERPSPIIDIPYKKKANPPRKESTEKMSIIPKLL